jgi:hypothetical protein
MVPIGELPFVENGHDNRVRRPIILNLERFWDRVAGDRRGTRLYLLGQGSSRRGEGC